MTPLYLLLGCAVPLWLALALRPDAADGPPRSADDSPIGGFRGGSSGGFPSGPPPPLPPPLHPAPFPPAMACCLVGLAGVLAVGIGDAAAAVVGKSFGRIFWPG
jgi:hypothetical protein